MASQSSTGRGRNLGCFAKTKMCRFHILGLCTRGSECAFAHNKEELNVIPDFTRTKLCKTLCETGQCLDPKCLFAHSVDELRSSSTMFVKTKMCHFHQMGDCSLGSKCNFAHSVSELRDEPLIEQESLVHKPVFWNRASSECLVGRSSAVEVQSWEAGGGKSGPRDGRKERKHQKQLDEMAPVLHAGYVKAKPVGLVKEDLENTRLPPPAPDVDLASVAAQSRFAASPVPDRDSPLYLFHSEPHRPGSFRTVRDSMEGTRELSNLVIGQIADHKNVAESKPLSSDLKGGLEVKLPIPGKLCDFGMGQSASSQPGVTGIAASDLASGHHTMAPQSAVPLDFGGVMGPDGIGGRASVATVPGSVGGNFLANALFSKQRAEDNASWTKSIPSHAERSFATSDVAETLAVQAQAGRGFSGLPLTRPDGVELGHSRNTFVSFTPAFRPIRAVRTAEAALSSLAEDSDEASDAEGNVFSKHVHFRLGL